MAVDQQKLERLRSAVEATLEVLIARVAGAQDYEDWRTINIQTLELKLTVASALKEASKA